LQELNIQRQGLEAKNRKLVKYELKLKMVDIQIASLENALSAAKNKIIVLRDNYLFLVYEKANLEGRVRQILT